MIIRDRIDLKRIIDQEHKEGHTVVFKGGCFDILHPGHADVLKQLKTYGDIVIIAVLADDRVRAKKGEQRPINNQEQRMIMVENLKGVDYVYLDNCINRSEYLDLLNNVRPDVVVITETDEEKRKSYSSMSWKLIELPDKNLPGYSTTDIINKVIERYC